jgi:hypothetical protein
MGIARVVVLTSVVLSWPLLATAQAGPTDRGSILVGGTASVSRSTYEIGDTDNTSTGISLSPDLLVFVAPRFALGGRLGLSWVDYDDGRSSSWLIGPAARFYFAPGSARTLPFLGASVSFGGATSENDVVDSTVESDVWAVEGVAGITWMLSRQVGITGEAFLERANITNGTSLSDVETRRTDLGVRFGFAAFFFR